MVKNREKSKLMRVTFLEMGRLVCSLKECLRWEGEGVLFHNKEKVKKHCNTAIGNASLFFSR